MKAPSAKSAHQALNALRNLIGVASAERFRASVTLSRFIEAHSEETPSLSPIPMILHCPRCHVQHIDAPDENVKWCVGCTPDNCSGCNEGEGKWTNPPHRSHLCASCGFIWRPADVPTEGVASIKTRGANDSWPPALQALSDTAALVEKTRADPEAWAALQSAVNEVTKRIQEAGEALMESIGIRPAPPPEQATPAEPQGELDLPRGDAPLTHDERSDAEQAYSVTAFDYVSAPIGSRDWSLYWRGWSHRATCYAAPQAAAQGEAVAPDPQLCAFYQVSTVAELLAAQEAHILSLQEAARRNVKPWEDTFPPTLLPKYMRDLAPPADLVARLEGLAKECNGIEGLGSGVIAARIRAIIAGHLS